MGCHEAEIAVKLQRVLLKLCFNICYNLVMKSESSARFAFYKQPKRGPQIFQIWNEYVAWFTCDCSQWPSNLTSCTDPYDPVAWWLRCLIGLPTLWEGGFWLIVGQCCALVGSFMISTVLPCVSHFRWESASNSWLICAARHSCTAISLFNQ